MQTVSLVTGLMAEIPPKYENLCECYLRDTCFLPLCASLSVCPSRRLLRINVNYPTVSVQDENADSQLGDGPHGCEIPPKYENLCDCYLRDTCVLPLCASLSVCPSGRLLRINPHLLYYVFYFCTAR